MKLPRPVDHLHQISRLIIMQLYPLFHCTRQVMMRWHQEKQLVVLPITGSYSDALRSRVARVCCVSALGRLVERIACVDPTD
jgi:hypothetical protein